MCNLVFSYLILCNSYVWQNQRARSLLSWQELERRGYGQTKKCARWVQKGAEEMGVCLRHKFCCSWRRRKRRREMRGRCQISYCHLQDRTLTYEVMCVCYRIAFICFIFKQCHEWMKSRNVHIHPLVCHVLSLSGLLSSPALGAAVPHLASRQIKYRQ